MRCTSNHIICAKCTNVHCVLTAMCNTKRVNKNQQPTHTWSQWTSARVYAISYLSCLFRCIQRCNMLSATVLHKYSFECLFLFCASTSIDVFCFTICKRFVCLLFFFLRWTFVVWSLNSLIHHSVMSAIENVRKYTRIHLEMININNGWEERKTHTKPNKIKMLALCS